MVECFVFLRPLGLRLTDPKHYSLEFENDSVRVVRISYGPGERSDMHDHPDGVAVFLTDQHSKFTYPGGGTEILRTKAGSRIVAMSFCEPRSW